MSNIYADIAKRTGGDIYIGVVGPVRTGKSTLIKRMMEELVIPNIEDLYQRERAKDELPQSGSGRTIMTAEPKFVPNEAARISPDGYVVTEGDQVFLGGNDSYIAMCHKCYQDYINEHRKVELLHGTERDPQ